MGVDEKIGLDLGDRRKVHGGVSCPPASAWTAFEWLEPRLGLQTHGEITVIRTHGTSGNLTAGFWRTHANAPGANRDGTHAVVYSAPLGDETACVIDGTATLTIAATGEQFRIGPGDVVSSPKGLEVHWRIDGPSFKKYWCIFDGTQPAANPPQALKITSINDNPPAWQAYHFTEPKEGPLVAGELYFIREGGATGTMLSGVWRSGKGIAGSIVDANGAMTTAYTGVLGDETILLLEGEVNVTETDTGRVHHFRAGDVIGLSSGQHITWTSRGPFSKKLWVITRDALAG